jgi:hypothetical protein
VLVDLCNTHDFIDFKLVSILDLLSCACPPLKVNVINGIGITCEVCATYANLRTRSYSLMIDFY